MTDVNDQEMSIFSSSHPEGASNVSFVSGNFLSSLTSNSSTARFIEDEASNLALNMLRQAARLPVVKIQRETYLRGILSKVAAPEVVEQAIATSPALAGIAFHDLDVLASKEIAKETYRVSGLSFVAGLPGGIGLFAAVPADVAQYFAHMMRIEQKLAYLYGWQSLTDEQGRITDETMNSLIALMGVMLAVEGVEGAVRAATVSMAQQGMVKYAKRRAILQSIDQPILHRVLSFIGRKLGEEGAKKVAGKVLPVLGGVLSGGMTYASFKPAALRLQTYLRSLPLAQGISFEVEVQGSGR